MTNPSPPKYTVQIIIIAGLFFIFGFVTWINGALIPFMKSINELTDAQAYLVASASYISFVIMALPSSYILSKIGYKRGMSLGLIIMGLGALVFIPAAEARTYWVFLSGIFIQGVGMTLLQTAANPYITILGSIESGARRIAIMGICNKVAGALGSLIFGGLLLSNIGEIKEQILTVSDAEKDQILHTAANSVVLPYVIMAIVLFILGISINRAPLPDLNQKEEKADVVYGTYSKKNIFSFPHLWIGVITLFLYVGAEVIAADSIINYGLHLGFPVEEAKFFTTITLMTMVLMYSVGIILIPKYISQEFSLLLSAILGIIFTACIIFTVGITSIIFVAALGLANALMWPAIWPLTLRGLGRFTKTASALLVMAIAGGAILPPLYGHLVDIQKAKLMTEGLGESLSMAQASTSSYWILFPCYIMILFYAIKGHKIKHRH